MIECTYFDLSTGKLDEYRHMGSEAERALNQRPGYGLVDGIWDHRTHYVQNDQAIPRPDQATTLNGLTLMNVPPGSTVLLDGQSYPAEGDVELECPLPGTYQLRVIAWPYKDWEGEVTV